MFVQRFYAKTGVLKTKSKRIRFNVHLYEAACIYWQSNQQLDSISADSAHNTKRPNCLRTTASHRTFEGLALTSHDKHSTCESIRPLRKHVSVIFLRIFFFYIRNYANENCRTKVDHCSYENVQDLVHQSWLFSSQYMEILFFRINLMSC